MDEEGTEREIRIFTPASNGEKLPIIMCLHGGGWRVGDIRKDDYRWSAIAARVPAIVVTVDYRLVSKEVCYPIPLSYSWANQKVSIQTSADPNAPSGDTSRLSEFLALFDKKIDFEPSHVQGDAEGDAFNGTFEEMLLKIQSTLGEDQMSTDAILNNYAVTISDLYVDREGVTGVDLNDEAANLMTYQKAYAAACRLMTTLEEALDSLINSMM